MEYNNWNIFLEKYAENEVESKWSAAYFQYVSITRNLAYNENKQYKTLGY